LTIARLYANIFYCKQQEPLGKGGRAAISSSAFGGEYIRKEVNKMYAIIETGGKQYNVEAGGVIKIEKLDAQVGDKVTFDNVLFVSGDDAPKVGAPYVGGASVVASVLAQGKDKKVVVYKYKSKKGYHKKKGHRQPFTTMRIEAINA